MKVASTTSRLYASFFFPGKAGKEKIGREFPCPGSEGALWAPSCAPMIADEATDFWGIKGAF